jgi:uncharacterized membrane protein
MATMGVDTVTERQVEQHQARRPSRPRRLWWRLRRWVSNLPRFPLALAFVGYLASDTPSLLPRPWYFQGLIGGISALIFYVIGLILEGIWHLFAQWSGFRMTIRPQARTVLRRIWYVLVLLAVLAYPFINAAWHRYVTAYVGEQPPGPLYPLVSILTAILVAALFIGIWHLFLRLTHWVTARLERRVVRVAIARVVATAVTVLVVVAVFDQVIIRGLLLAAREQADAVNKITPSGVFTPASPLRSGGPGSLVPWDSVGADGKSFLSSGPNAARVSVVTRDEEAKEPIRIFASTSSDRNLEATKNLVMAEMDRTKAWERKAILVVTSTSTGFVNEWAAESFEYLLHGDSAIVTMQYSTLPSALGCSPHGTSRPRSAGCSSRRSRPSSRCFRRTRDRSSTPVASPSARSAATGRSSPRTTCSRSLTAPCGRGLRRSPTTTRCSRQNGHSGPRHLTQ